MTPSYEGLGNLTDGRLLWLGDFRGTGRAQLLFMYPQDRNWWLGTFSNAAMEMSWIYAGNTSGFGDLLAGQQFWVGRFSVNDRDQILFYYPSDQNWWLGTFQEEPGLIRWQSVGNTNRFGNPTGHMFWSGRFTGDGLDHMIAYNPDNQNWQLGTYNPVMRRFQWIAAGNTSNFGNLLAGQMFWTGRFSQGGREEVLFYNPSDQNWWLGSYDDSTATLKWTLAGNTSNFGNLLAGHRFWIGSFSRSDRSEVLFYYPGDQNWWLGSYDDSARKLQWNQVANTTLSALNPLGSVWVSRFSRSDRDRLLVYAPQSRDTWLGGAEDDSNWFVWRFAGNTDRPHCSGPSMLLRKRIREMYGNLVPGCVFYVTRNGRPFADGSFGDARRRGSPDGQIAMSASSLVHIASIGKFICIVAILRLMQEWNHILLQPVKASEPKLDQTAHASGVPLDTNTKVFPLLESFLDRSLIASYRSSFPGQNVRNITIGQLLGHTSDLAQDFVAEDLNGLNHDDVEFQPPQGEGTSHIDLPKAVTALFRHDAIPPVTDPPTPPNQSRYNNAGYTVLGAVIEATTGAFYTDWVRQRLLSDPRFVDISRNVVDPLRSARYYQRDDNGFFSGGVHHPNYTSWSADGGWYVSAAAFCEWVDAIMQKKFVGGAAILQNPEVLLQDFTLGVNPYAVGRLRGFEKNGGAGPGGGWTNCRFAYLKGYGTERVCGFAEANANINADALLDVGFAALAESLGHQPCGLTISGSVIPGLFQTIYFDEDGILKSTSQSVPVNVTSKRVGDVTANRTDLLGSGSLPEKATLEMTGFIHAPTSGSYGFRLTSDDGSFLWVDDDLIVDNSGDHDLRCMESDPVWMERGTWYPIRVRLHNAGGGAGLFLEWRPPRASGFDAVPVTEFALHG